MGRNTRSSYKDEVQFVLQVDFGGSKVRILSAEKRFDSSEPPFNLVQRWPGEKDVRPYVPVVVAVEKQDEKTKFWGWEAEDMRRARPDDFVICRNLKRALGPDEEIIDEEQLLENERDQDDYLYFSTRAQDLRNAKKYGHNVSDMARYFFKEMIEYAIRPGKEIHQQVVTVTVPGSWDKGQSRKYAKNIQKLLPERAAVRLVDEPSAAFIGMIDDLSRNTGNVLSPGRWYVVVDLGSTTTDAARGHLMQLQPLEYDFGCRESFWVGSRSIDTGVANTICDHPKATQTVMDIYTKAIEDCKHNIPAATKGRHNPGPLPKKLWIACQKKAVGTNERLDELRVDFIRNFVKPMSALPAAILVTGGGNGSETMKSGMEEMANKTFAGVDVIFASDSPIAQFGGESNQHVLQGLRAIAINPALGTPRYAAADLFLFNHREDSRFEEPGIEPLCLWHEGMDFRPEQNKAAKAAYPLDFDLEPDTNDSSTGLDIQLTTNRFREDIAMSQRPRVVRGKCVSLEYLEPDVSHTTNLPIELPEGCKHARVYAQPELLGVLLGVVYRLDGAPVPQLLEMPLNDVLDGGIHGARLKLALADEHALHYQQARALFITDPRKLRPRHAGVKRKRDDTSDIGKAAARSKPSLKVVLKANPAKDRK